MIHQKRSWLVSTEMTIVLPHYCYKKLLQMYVKHNTLIKYLSTVYIANYLYIVICEYCSLQIIIIMWNTITKLCTSNTKCIHICNYIQWNSLSNSKVNNGDMCFATFVLDASNIICDCASKNQSYLILVILCVYYVYKHIQQLSDII